MCVLFICLTAMPNQFTPRSPFHRWAPFLAFILAIGFLESYVPFHKAITTLLFSVLVLMIARSNGLLAGVVASSAGALILVYLLPPRGSLMVNHLDDRALVILFVLCGSVASRWVTSLQRA
jgi:K+-sensing histidine kinase KdpD